MAPPYLRIASGHRERQRAAMTLDDSHITSVCIPLVRVWSHGYNSCRGKAGKCILRSVGLSAQPKVRGFNSIGEGENGHEGQLVVSATDEKKMCGHQYPPLCEDSTGTDIISPIRPLRGYFNHPDVSGSF